MMGPAAIAYARRGWRVFPIWPIRNGQCACGRPCGRDAGKHPIAALAPRGVRDATTGEPMITVRWTTCPDASIGIATGAVSGLLVLDVDGEGGEASLAALEREHGPLPGTPIALTGKGRHLYFAAPRGVPVPNRVRFLPGLDLRGDGGYVVAPPSTHLTRHVYAWKIGHEPDDVPLVHVPGWLLERIRADRPTAAPRPPDEWAALVRGPIAEGARNDSLARLAGYLLRRRPAPHVVLELVRAVNVARCRPPLPDHEIERTVDSIARRELARTRARLC
jgi:hypothetical protein